MLKVYLAEEISDDEALDLVDRLCNHKKKWQFWKKNSYCKFYCATLTTEKE